MRSSPDTSGGQPLTEAVPAPSISHMQFVDHDVLLHFRDSVHTYICGRPLPVPDMSATISRYLRAAKPLHVASTKSEAITASKMTW